MTAVQFLMAMERLGVTFSLDDGLLKATAPKGVLSDVLVAQLREHKPELTELLLRLRGKVGIPQRELGSALEASFAQKRLWFLSQLDSVSGTYHMSFGFRL